jgi:phosphate uptake regulator
MGFFDFFRSSDPPRLVQQAFDDVKVMILTGHEMFAAATAQLLYNEILDVDLGMMDGEINTREQHLRRAVLDHLTQEPGKALIFSLKLISIVHEAERIGDLAKSCAKVATLAHKPRMGPLVEPLRDFRGRILEMFEQIRKGFFEDDEAIARELMLTHEQLKQDITQYLRLLAEREGATVNEGVVYALGARLMSRVSSHLANIASTVALPFEQISRSSTWPQERRKGE